jgi:tetratricopeptide (TPR) repeat protein
MVSAGGRFADPQLIHALMERSYGARYRNPRKTLHLAQLAQLAAEACTSKVAGGRAHLADLRARAWTQYGNAFRISGRPRESEEAFTTAQRHRESGTGDPRLRAWMLERITPLATLQNRFEDAIRMCEEAGTIYLELGERHLLASTLVQKSIASLYSGDAESAIGLLNQAIPLIDSEEDHHLLLAANHNLAACYIEMDCPEEALALHYAARPLYQECKDPLNLLRAIWQEGTLLREIGHLHSAEVSLLRARQGFTEQGLAYEAGLVSLDLAEVFSKLGKPDELRKVITEATPIFRALGLGREVLASLLLQQRIPSEAAHLLGEGI